VKNAHVALLRGINLGYRRLPMTGLADLFRSAGARDVRTYIQSGNVVFSAPAAVARRVPAIVEQAIERQYGFEVPIVMRTAAELTDVVRRNPFLNDGADAKTLHVAFLLDRPAGAKVAALDPHRSPPDTFVVRGREIYLHLPHGMGRSKLTTQYFDSTLATVTTARNWRTVQTLLAMATAD